MYNETTKLAHTSVGDKYTNNQFEQLVAKARADGYNREQAIQIARKAQKRLNNTETGVAGHSVGVAHKPVERYLAIKKRLGLLK